MIPLSSSEEITPAWLSEALRGAGITTEVRAVKIEDGSAGRGFAGRILRLTPGYSKPVKDAPESLIAKLPLAHDSTQGKSAAPAPWAAVEIDWYTRRSRATTPRMLRIPRCYAAEIDDTGTRYCLLLEDLKDLDVVHQGQGASLQQAQAAVNAITKLHAPNWGSTDVERRDAARRNASLRDAVLTGWDAFISLYDALLTAEFRNCRDQLAASVDAIAEHLRYSCPTTVHGDYKLDNMLFGEPGSGDEIVVLDWQAVGFGSAVEDLAGFLQTSLTIETRRVAEQDLLQLYQRQLEENGVETYPAHQLQLDYKLALLTKIAGSIGGCANIVSGTWAGTDNRRNRRIREYSLMTFQRRIASVLDNDALSLMDPPY